MIYYRNLVSPYNPSVSSQLRLWMRHYEMLIAAKKFKEDLLLLSCACEVTYSGRAIWPRVGGSLQFAF